MGCQSPLKGVIGLQGAPAAWQHVTEVGVASLEFTELKSTPVLISSNHPHYAPTCLVLHGS